MALNRIQRELLSALIASVPETGGGTNYLIFRAKHDDHLVELDQLEQMNWIARNGDDYVVRLRALSVTCDAGSRSERILHACRSVYTVMRVEYRKSPEMPVTLETIVQRADIPLPEVLKSLHYLLPTSLWRTHSAIVDGQSTVTPSETFLRFKTFDDFLNSLLHPAPLFAQHVPARERQQKFQILDAPNLLATDLQDEMDCLGRAVIYLDLDGFKAINNQLTETIVDQEILPSLHRLLATCMKRLGYAYGEGGDEFTFVLMNGTSGMAVELAKALRDEIRSISFSGEAQGVKLTASVGLAHTTTRDEIEILKARANEAKRFAKESGKDCVALWTEDGCKLAA